jgi:gamma-tubulin complex component 5
MSSANLSLVEKFQILGRDDIASPLETWLPYILSPDADIEVLTLLLALSDRPLDAGTFDHRKFVVRAEVKKEITWEEILAEEPLVGEHWAEPTYEGSDEESDWVFEGPTVVEGRSLGGEEEERRIDEVVGDDETKKEVEGVLGRQYWLRRTKVAVIDDLNLGIALDEDFSDLDRSSEEYYLFTELDAIREVLFMLSGLDCVLFKTHKRRIEVSAPLCGTF